MSSTSPFEAESQFLEVVTVKVILKTVLKERKMTKTIKRRKKKRIKRIVNISIYFDCRVYLRMEKRST